MGLILYMSNGQIHISFCDYYHIDIITIFIFKMVSRDPSTFLMSTSLSCYTAGETVYT